MTPIEHDPVGDESFAYVIRGGNPISGTVKPGGNKNAALPMIAACLLADGAGHLVQRSADPRCPDAAPTDLGPRGRCHRRGAGPLADLGE